MISQRETDEYFDNATHLLRCGEYLKAWPLWKFRPPRIKSPFLRSSIPEWKGENVSGKRLILVGEQGLGDEIMFSRYVPVVRNLNPEHITLACRPENIRALSHLGANDIIDRLSTRYIPRYDYWIQLGSIPEIFSTTIDNIPPPSPPPIRIKSGGGIGIITSGNPDLPTDKYRSLPPGSHVCGARSLIAHGDMLDSYEQVSEIDLLITVDTSWAHVGGTLGKPVWLLLPKLNGLDWRWMHNRTDSPWYPSVRIFRQTEDGDWNSVMLKVQLELKKIGTI